MLSTCGVQGVNFLSFFSMAGWESECWGRLVMETCAYSSELWKCREVAFNAECELFSFQFFNPIAFGLPGGNVWFVCPKVGNLHRDFKVCFVFENPVKLDVQVTELWSRLEHFWACPGWLSKCFSFTYAFLTRSKWHLLGPFISLRQCCVFARGV